jgi:hypothetical protein
MEEFEWNKMTTAGHRTVTPQFATGEVRDELRKTFARGTGLIRPRIDFLPFIDNDLRELHVGTKDAVTNLTCNRLTH